MSRFSDEMKIIPTPARVIAGLVYVLWAIGFWAMYTFSGDPGMSKLPIVGVGALMFLASIPVVIWISTDRLRERGRQATRMRYVMWTLLAIFIPTRSGSSSTSILRDPMMKGVPNCCRR